MAIQGSEEWFLERCGCATASNFSSVLAKGEGKTRRAYMLRVVGERLSGKPYEGFKSKDLDRGNEHEPFSRIAYEAKTGNLVEQVGFIRHSELMAGASPDGLVGEEGGIEMKNVIPSVQVETLDRGGFPSEHKPQIYGNLWITRRKWWDFVSHCEDMPEPFKTYIFRVERNEDYIANLEKEVRRFLDEADNMIEQLTRKAA